MSNKKVTQAFGSCSRTCVPILFKLTMNIVRKMAKIIVTKTNSLGVLPHLECVWLRSRGVVLRTLLVGHKGFTGSLSIPNLTFCSDFGSSAHSRGFLHSDLVEEIRHLAFYNAGMPNIRIVTSVAGRAQRSIGRASALPGLLQNDTRA